MWDDFVDLFIEIMKAFGVSILMLIIAAAIGGVVYGLVEAFH